MPHDPPKAETTIPANAVRIRVTQDIRGRWHDDTWYRVGQEFLAVPTSPPYTPGWRVLPPHDIGDVAAAHAEVVCHVQ